MGRLGSSHEDGFRRLCRPDVRFCGIGLSTYRLDGLRHRGGHLAYTHIRTRIWLLHPPPVWVRSIVICMSACLLVCLSVPSHNSKTTRPTFTKFSLGLHVTCGRGSVPYVARQVVVPSQVNWWRLVTLFKQIKSN